MRRPQAARPNWQCFSELALFGLPFATAGVVALALFGGRTRPYRSARVYGSTSEGLETLALRVEVVERVFDIESPLTAGRVWLSASSSAGERVRAVGSLDPSGVAEIDLRLTRARSGPLFVEVHDASGSPLARGPVSVPHAAWLAHVRRRGGWVHAKTAAGLRVSVAPGRGAFAVPYREPLWIEVERDGKPERDARLAIRCDGGRIDPEGPVLSDARGRAVVGVRVLEHSVSLHVRAEASDGTLGQIECALPVVPGAMRASLNAGQLRIESPVERDRAYFSQLGTRGRLGGGSVALSPDGHGGALAELALPSAERPSWVVVSSSLDENSIAAVGWPLFVGDEPETTFDIPETLWLDGAALGRARERGHRARIRWLTAAFCVLALGTTAALFFTRVRRADLELERHLEGRLPHEQIERVAPHAPRALWLALALLMLGFLALALVVSLRLG